jgi:hypothetical protein
LQKCKSRIITRDLTSDDLSDVRNREYTLISGVSAQVPKTETCMITLISGVPRALGFTTVANSGNECVGGTG